MDNLDKKTIMKNALNKFGVERLIISNGYLEAYIHKLDVFEIKKDQRRTFLLLTKFYNLEISFFGVYTQDKERSYLYAYRDDIHCLGFAREKEIKQSGLINKFPTKPRTEDMNFFALFYEG